jgi:Plasmid encoded RepA protein
LDEYFYINADESASSKRLRKATSPKKINRLLEATVQMSRESAFAADAIYYAPRYLAMVSMLHSKSAVNEYTVKSGSMQMSMMAPSSVGLPYGSLPRLILIYLATEAFKKKSRQIQIGMTFCAFMDQFGIRATGGSTGSMSSFKRQLQSLLSTTIYTKWDGNELTRLSNTVVAEEATLWWASDQKKSDYKKVSNIVLGEGFYEEIQASAVPVDMRALIALKGSPMAIDIYIWLTYRMSHLKSYFGRPIPWASLQKQFGSGFETSEQGLWNFRRSFTKHFKMVQIIYSDASAEISIRGVVLRPSPTHVPKRSCPQKSVN